MAWAFFKYKLQETTTLFLLFRRRRQPSSQWKRDMFLLSCFSQSWLGLYQFNGIGQCKNTGKKSFVVPFPCKEELDRMLAIRRVTTKNREGILIIQEFDDDIKPIKVLDQVWVTVTNVPRVLRSFLPLWVVGSIIGATQKFDVIHLRQTGEVRILVAVFDAKQIPKQADVCVNRSICRIFFKAVEVLRDDSFNPDEDDLLEGDDNNDLAGT